MRICRILLHEIIRNQSVADSKAIMSIFTEEEYKKQNKQSILTMMTIQAEILASLPSHIPNNLYNDPNALMEGSRDYYLL
jgi:hypothetical protein